MARRIPRVGDRVEVYDHKCDFMGEGTISVVGDLNLTDNEGRSVQVCDFPIRIDLDDGQAVDGLYCVLLYLDEVLR